MRVTLAFLLFCFFEGSVWLFGEGVSDPAVALLLFGFACLVVGGVLSAIAWRTRTKEGHHARWDLILTSVAAIGLPAVLTAFSQLRLGASTVLAAWAFLPVVVVGYGFLTQVGPDAAGNESLLVWALCGLGGELLLLPVTLPSSPGGRFSLLLVLMGVGFAGVAAPRTFHLLCKRGSLAELGLVALTNGTFTVVVAMIWVWLNEGSLRLLESELSQSDALRVLIEAPLLLLFLRSVKPLTYSTRVLFAPAVAALEGAAVFRAGLSIRMAAGILLVLLATGMLWRKDQQDVTTSMSLLV